MASNYLYLYDNDLRTNYLPILSEFMQALNSGSATTLRCAYILDPKHLVANQFEAALISPAKLKVIIDSLEELGQVLANRGILLHIIVGNKSTSLETLIEKYNITHLGYSSPIGSYEKRPFQIPALKDVSIFNEDQTSLFNRSTLPFAVDDLPPTFTRFRKEVEALPLDKLFSDYKKLPILNSVKNAALNIRAQFQDVFLTLIEHHKVKATLVEAESMLLEFAGGETAAVSHLNNYFSLTSASVYKQTRNFLENWSASTKFSVALCLGNISPKYIWREIVKYELKNGANESTYWIKFELLWREYFYWYSAKYNEKLFYFSGITQNKPLSSFYPERYRKWVDGATPSHFINAIMIQLKTTGYISNRSRQITASYFINELALDWRYGAAYFQSQLIDHDVASNWGNWQYLAGVGCDPRGKRKFNIDKQQHLYDPNMTYINKWITNATTLPLDSVDYVDWPIVNEEQ